MEEIEVEIEKAEKIIDHPVDKIYESRKKISEYYRSGKNQNIGVKSNNKEDKEGLQGSFI